MTEKTELRRYFEEESPTPSHVAPEAPAVRGSGGVGVSSRARGRAAGTGSGVDGKIRGLARSVRPSSSEGKNNDNDGLTKRLKCTLASGRGGAMCERGSVPTGDRQDS